MFTRPCHEAAACGFLSRSLLRRFSLVALLSFLGATVAPGADLSQAVVRQKMNIVTVAPNLGAQAKPAAQGEIIYDKNVVQTGTASKAELEFADRTRARLTANAIFTFDVAAREMTLKQGAGLISKPTNSGKIDFTSGAVSGAITGSTVFISTVPNEGSGKPGQRRSNGKGTTTLVGMLEGKVQGGSRWTDSAGREHSKPFKLGPGEMLVARPDGPPYMAQFDIPRFLKTSPLVKGFKAPLPNPDALARAVAAYEADDRAGFIDRSNVMVTTGPVNMGLVGQVPIFDTVAELKAANNGFFPGPTGVIRAQLVWNSAADLDLYLTLPNGQVVSFGNVSVRFNNGTALATLDHDNTGNTINFPPQTRVENIVVNGIPLAGLYRFIVNNFNTPNGFDAFTLRVFYNGRTQVLNGNLRGGQSSVPVVVQVPPR
jgi:hypothetical protein